MHLQWISRVWDVFLDFCRCFWLFFSSPFPHFWTHWTHFEEVIRSDFNYTMITIAHRIHTVQWSFDSKTLKRMFKSVSIPMTGWTMTRLQSLKEEQWSSLNRPRARLQWNMSNSAPENFPKHCHEKIISCTFIIAKEGGAIWFAKQPCKRRQTTSENSEVFAFHNVSLERCSATMKPFSGCADEEIAMRRAWDKFVGALEKAMALFVDA